MPKARTRRRRPRLSKRRAASALRQAGQNIVSRAKGEGDSHDFGEGAAAAAPRQDGARGGGAGEHGARVADDVRADHSRLERIKRQCIALEERIPDEAKVGSAISARAAKLQRPAVRVHLGPPRDCLLYFPLRRKIHLAACNGAICSDWGHITSNLTCLPCNAPRVQASHAAIICPHCLPKVLRTLTRWVFSGPRPHVSSQPWPCMVRGQQALAGLRPHKSFKSTG